MITIIVEGPEHSGKGHAIAMIAKLLKSAGLDVTVQGERTHNAKKLTLTEEEHINRLADAKIFIKEMRTSV
ncbi:MAG: hypothetical protein ABSB19_15960 [Methylomonas sp.]|jgi:thymidylate kinase